MRTHPDDTPTLGRVVRDPLMKCDAQMTATENDTPRPEDTVPMHPCPRVLIGAYVFIILLLLAAAGFFVVTSVMSRSVTGLALALIFGVPALAVMGSRGRFWRVWRATLAEEASAEE